MHSANEAYKNAKSELNKLLANQEQFQTVLDHCEKYFDLKNKKELTPAEQVKLKIYTQTVQRVHVSDESDIDSIQNLKNSTDRKIEALTQNFRALENQFQTYSDIVKTYYEISNGDYISKLVEEQYRKEQENKKGKAI